MNTMKTLSLIVVAVALGVAAGAGAQEPQRGGTLIHAIDSNPETLVPALTTAGVTWATGCKIFNGLVYMDRQYRPQPELAESWTVSRDGKQIIFKLRQGIQWHDGKPFTSADVHFTFTEVLPKYHPATRPAFQHVAAVEAPDASTVVVKFKEPYAPFLTHMMCQYGAIVPKHIYAGTDILKNPRNTDNPVGTGPFMFKEWQRGSHIVYVRNPNYWRKGLPYLDRVISKIIPDQSARALALETGEVDFINSFMLPKDQVPQLAKNANLQSKQDVDLPGNYMLFFNTRVKPLDQAKARQALTVGLNREQIIQQAFFGLGGSGRSAVSQALAWAYNPKIDYRKMYAFDPARANQMLDEAGLKRGAGGTRFAISMVYQPAFTALEPIAQIIRSNWRDLGVDVQLQPVERQIMIDKVFNTSEFGITVIPYTTGGDPAIGVVRSYVTAAKPVRPFTNPTGYSNPEVDRLARLGASTLDLEERAKHYFQIQEIVAQDLPAVNIVDRPEVDVASKKARGLWQRAVPYDGWEFIWMSK
jgi:peptide/nickel transport system substrate-binding protein